MTLRLVVFSWSCVSRSLAPGNLVTLEVLWHLVEEEPHRLAILSHEGVGRWTQASKKVPREASGMAVHGVVGLRLLS